MLTTAVEQAAWAYRTGFFNRETVEFMIREHEGHDNGLGTRTPLGPGAQLSKLANILALSPDKALPGHPARVSASLPGHLAVLLKAG